MTRLELEPMLAHDHREEDLRLHHREVVSDARARAAAERQICVAGALLGALGTEPLGVEALRVLPVIGVSMQDVRTQPDDRAGLDGMSA